MVQLLVVIGTGRDGTTGLMRSLVDVLSGIAYHRVSLAGSRWCLLLVVDLLQRTIITAESDRSRLELVNVRIAWIVRLILKHILSRVQ